MQQAIGGIFRLWLRSAALSGALAAPGWAQGATGKLEGVVHDGQGRPLAGAQVYLVGSAYGAVTNPRGRYFINNVPAGEWTARAAFLGHRPMEVRGLRVLDGQTATQDFALEAAALELQTIEVHAAMEALVPRDEVTTKQRIDGQFADALPVDRISTLLSLQPGVVEVRESYMSGGGQDTEGGLSIRGGRPSQHAVYIDGVPVQPGYYGSRLHGWLDIGSTGTTLTLGFRALQEASVTTGAPSAQFGNATSGIVSLVTGIGGRRLRGSLSVETDEVFGVHHGPGFNRLESGLSGPLGSNLTFALSGLLEGHRSIEEGFESQRVPVFVPAGVDTTIRQPSQLEDNPGTAVDESVLTDTTLVNVYRYAIARGRCDHFARAGEAGLGGPDSAAIRAMRENYGFECGGVRMPVTPRTLHSVSGRLTQTYGAGSRVSITLSASRFHGHRFNFIIPHVSRLTSGISRGFSNRSRLATLNWVHNLSRSADRALALDLAVSYQEDRTISGPLTTPSRAATRNAFGGFILQPLRFMYDFENFPLNEALITNIRRNHGRVTPRERGNRSYDVPLNIRNNPYALYGEFGGFLSTMDGFFWRFPDVPGVVGIAPLNLYRETRQVAKGALDWQADRYNRLKLGAEVTRYSIGHYASLLGDRDVGEAYLERPLRWSAYAEDRLDLGDVIVVGGLRYDWYHTRASRPYVSDSAGHRYHLPRISSLPDLDLANPTAHFVKDRSHDYLSPHVQVSFPVTDRTNFRLSYAHQVQAPDFGLVLSGINGDLGLESERKAYGSDLDFGKTIALEFGIRHAFGADMVLDVAAYHRTVVSDPAVRLVSRYDPVLDRVRDLRVLTNLDFGAVQGIDVRLDRRFGRVFSGTIGYAYQSARSTGSDPFTYINFGARVVNEIGGVNGVQPPPQALLPTDHSRPHVLTGAFSLTVPGDWKRGSPLGVILGDVSLFSTLRYTSGTAYTPCGPGSEDQSVMSSEFCIRDLPEGINSRRLPAFKEVNVRVTKSVAVGGLDVTAYADLRNVLDFKNVLQVFAANGSLRNDVERQANLESDLLQLAIERDVNAAVATDGVSIQLPEVRAECERWTSSKLRPAAANCVYLIRAEQRYGDGDGIFTIAEQTAASNALYDVARGEQEHTGPGRRARIGLEIAF